MTGYGSGAASNETHFLEVEIHSVNQRGLVVAVHAPREWGGLETEISTFLRPKVARGKISVQLRIGRESGDKEEEPADWSEVDRRVATLKKALDRFGSDSPISAEVLYRILSDCERDATAPSWEEVKEIAYEALDSALEGFLQMRSEEGARLLEEFINRTTLLREILQTIKELDENRIPQHKDALLARLQQMDLPLDSSDERVAKEVAFLADRSDVTEELTRIDSHLTALEESFSSNDPIGRKLEFILQELHREWNTIGSKASLAEISAKVIEAKQELEKLREQAANVE